MSFKDHLKKQLRKGLQGAMRGLAGGLQGKTYADVERERKNEEAERQAEIHRQFQEQIAQWEKLLGGGRSDSIKVVHGNGYADIYYGGVGSPDGEGHGHIRVHEDGTEQIVREPYKPNQPNARRDATLLDSKTPDKREK